MNSTENSKTPAKGKLYIVSGFSGAGKGTIMKRFMDDHEGFVLSVSDTTRDRREGEIPGVHYNFVTKDEFERNIADDKLIEYTVYQDNYYGTPRSFVTDNLEKGNDVFLEIEVDGCGKVKKIFPDAVTVFVVTPSASVLKERLENRGTDTKEKIHKRLKRALEEMDFVDDYDHILINDDLEKCVDELYDITRGRKMPATREDHETDAFLGAFYDDLSAIVEKGIE